MKNKIWNILLLALLLLTFITRIINIENLPLFGDEIDVGLQANSLLKTGKDYRGNFLPVYIQSYSESRAPLLMYITVPSIATFGLTPLGVRLPSVIFGVVSVFALFLLIKKITKNNALSLMSAFTMSILPWHFTYSRATFEVTLLLSLVTLACFYFYDFLENGKLSASLKSVLLFCLSFYTYNTANIFVPLIGLFLIFSNFTAFKKIAGFKIIAVNFILASVLLYPFIANIIFGNAANRFNLISIFNDQNTIENIIFKRTDFSSSNDQNFEKIFHNKAESWSRQFIANYTESISPYFMFITGDPNPRHHVDNTGLLPLAFLPLLFLGIFYTVRLSPGGKFMLFWLLISPIPAAMTVNGGHHATRLFLILPPLTYFISQGFIKIISSKIRPIVLVIIPVLVYNLFTFGHEYFTHYPKETFENWSYGYSELFTNQLGSSRVFVSNAKYDSLTHFLFYQSYDPKILISKNITDKEIPNVFSDMSGFSLPDNVVFINDWKSKSVIDKVKSIAQKDDIFILFQIKDIPGDWDFSKDKLQGFETLKTVYLPNKSILGQVIKKL